MYRDSVSILMERFGQKYSKVLGIDLEGKDPNEIFKWFFASLLFGARISETIVINTYRLFEKRRMLAPKRILEAGWDNLVRELDEGGYTRYDFKTADKLLEVSKNLVEWYGGDLNSLHSMADDPQDLEKRLKTLGKGIGEVTVNIFLRELRFIWEKADPPPQSLEIMAAKNLGFTKYEGKSVNEGKLVLKDLREVWRGLGVEGKTFTDFETALVRLGKNYCRKEKCVSCCLNDYCER